VPDAEPELPPDPPDWAEHEPDTRDQLDADAELEHGDDDMGGLL
jgi:hypothetical protein